MARKMLIDATHPEETRVVVVNGNKVEEFDFDATSRGLITGNIYLAKITRVEPSLQAAFVDYGGNRHGFLAFSEVHPDYYQIPQADREALLQEEIARQEEEEADDDAEDDEKQVKPTSKSRTRRRTTKPTETIAESSVDDESISSDPIVDSSEADDQKAENETKAEEVDESDVSKIEEKTSEEAPKRKSRSRRRSNKTPSEDVLADPRGDDSDDDAPSEVETVETDESDEEIRTQSRPRSRNKEPRVRPHNRYKIQEVVKVRQIMLVQVIKEERGNKGAALTTYLSLPGRYCVLMPNTARGGGISRKISNVQDRKRLKTLAKGFSVPKGAGLIVRTAGAKQDSAEIERDYAFLTRQWNQIRDLTLTSTAPSAVYAESGPIKRAIRDLLTNDTDEILIEGQTGFDEAHEYMNILMPERLKDVKLYTDTMPLFSRYQVEGYLGSMFNPIVQLPSGGYLVFGVTEALIAVDVNSGRSTKESSIEDTAVKTNLEAATEVARQLKLRDLAGLIVIDFIDMEQRRHQADVEHRLKDALRKDRARIQIGRISSFGLLEMSRQRLRTGLVEAITAPCAHCQGTGIQRSDDSLALMIIRSIEEEIARGRSNEIVARVPMNVANFLFNEKREHINSFFDRHGVVVKIVADHDLVSPNFEIEKSKVAGRPVPKASKPITAESVAESISSDDEQKPKRRRRRGGKGRNRNGQDGNDLNNSVEDKAEGSNPNETEALVENADVKAEKPKSKSRSRNKPKPDVVETFEVETVVTTEAEKEAKPKSRSRKKAKPDEVAQIEIVAQSDAVAQDEKPKKPRASRSKVKSIEIASNDSDVQLEEKPKAKRTGKKANPKEVTEPEVKAETKEAKVDVTAKAETMSFEPEAKAEKPKPKKKGWWSL